MVRIWARMAAAGATRRQDGRSGFREVADNVTRHLRAPRWLRLAGRSHVTAKRSILL